MGKFSHLDKYVDAYTKEYYSYYISGNLNSAMRFQEAFENSLSGLFDTSRGPVPAEYYSYVRSNVNSFINSLNWSNNVKIPYLPDYYNSYLSNNDFDEALKQILYGNPYLDTSDIDSMYPLSQSKRNELLSQRRQDALEWASEQVDTYRTNQQNTPVNQSEMMRLAGQNPDLLGTDGVASMESPDAVAPTPIEGIADYPLKVAGTIVDVVGTLASLGLGSANFLLQNANSAVQRRLQSTQADNLIANTLLSGAQKNLIDKNVGLVQSQIEANEINTLSTLDKVVTDWSLNNLQAEDFDKYYGIKREEYAKMALAQGRIKRLEDYVPTPEEEIDLSALGFEALIMDDETISQRLSGFSPNTISRVKGAYKRINPRSSYFQSKLSEWRKNRISNNVDIGRMMGDARYSDNVGVMSVLWSPTQNLLKKSFESELQFKTKSAQYQSELIDAIHKISETYGDLSPEEIAKLSLPELNAYKEKMSGLASIYESDYNKMLFNYFGDMFEVAEDIRFSNLPPEAFEQFMSSWYSLCVPLLKNFSMNSGAINGNLGANLTLGLGAYYNRSHNTSESTSENSNIDVAKILQLLGVIGE